MPDIAVPPVAGRSPGSGCELPHMPFPCSHLHAPTRRSPPGACFLLVQADRALDCVTTGAIRGRSVPLFSFSICYLHRLPTAHSGAALYALPGVGILDFCRGQLVLFARCSGALQFHFRWLKFTATAYHENSAYRTTTTATPAGRRQPLYWKKR